MGQFIRSKTVLAACVFVASMSSAAVAAQQTVTTPGGTTGYIPRFSGTATLGNSEIFDNGTNVGIGVGASPNSSVKLDVGGSMIMRGNMIVSRSGNATSGKGYPSYGFEFFSTAYNSSTKATDNPYFSLQSEPTGNNTSSPSATFNLLFSNNGAAAAETGFYINPNGTIHFSPSQTFPSSACIMSVAHDSSLTGAGTSASPLGIAAVSHDGNLAGDGTGSSPLALAPSIAVTGSISAGSYVSGVNEDTQFGIGVEGDDYSNGGVGVRGLSFDQGSGYSGYGMVAEGYVGIYAYGENFAGQFEGNVNVSGTLSKSGGSFKIDHPLDPANKYLSHSFVESPDMMNIYNGNVTTDATGTAVVTLPDYFQALNSNFRYQLTVVGEEFAQARIASKISNGTFTIKTDKPQVEISWQVTGVRQDAWANAHRIPNEEEKPEQDRGHYLHPELFGHAGEPSITAMRHPRQSIPKQ